jgi:hypothetical protein
VFGIAFGRTEPAPKDSVVILFGKSTRITLHAKDREELKALKDYDFNALLDQLVTLMEQDRRDTSFVMDGDTIVMRGGQVVIKGGGKKDPVTFSIKIGGGDGVQITNGDTTVTVNRDRKSRVTRTEFVFDLGLNNYLENGRIPTSPTPTTYSAPGVRGTWPSATCSKRGCSAARAPCTCTTARR